MSAGVFAATFAALFAAHQVADHWVQSDRQAQAKSRPGWAGRVACVDHVASYTATALVAVVVTDWVVGAQWSIGRLVVGLAVSAVSHYWADRRSTLAGLARALGKARFYALGAPRHVGAQTASGEPVFLVNQDRVPVALIDNPTLGTGAYALDQSWHVGWLWVAALIIAGGAS